MIPCTSCVFFAFQLGIVNFLKQLKTIDAKNSNLKNEFANCFFKYSFIKKLGQYDLHKSARNSKLSNTVVGILIRLMKDSIQK